MHTYVRWNLRTTARHQGQPHHYHREGAGGGEGAYVAMLASTCTHARAYRAVPAGVLRRSATWASVRTYVRTYVRACVLQPDRGGVRVRVRTYVRTYCVPVYVSSCLYCGAYFGGLFGPPWSSSGVVLRSLNRIPRSGQGGHWGRVKPDDPAGGGASLPRLTLVGKYVRT